MYVRVKGEGRVRGTVKGVGHGWRGMRGRGEGEGGEGSEIYECTRQMRMNCLKFGLVASALSLVWVWVWGRERASLGEGD